MEVRESPTGQIIVNGKVIEASIGGKQNSESTIHALILHICRFLPRKSLRKYRGSCAASTTWSRPRLSSERQPRHANTSGKSLQREPTKTSPGETKVTPMSSISHVEANRFNTMRAIAPQLPRRGCGVPLARRAPLRGGRQQRRALPHALRRQGARLPRRRGSPARAPHAPPALRPRSLRLHSHKVRWRARHI